MDHHIEHIHDQKFDGRAIHGCATFGDVVFLGLMVDREMDEIIEARFRVKGRKRAEDYFEQFCSVIEKTSIPNLMELSQQWFDLDGVHSDPQLQILAKELLQRALNLYFARSGQVERVTKEERIVICPCKDIAENDLRKAYLEGKQTLELLQGATGVAQECDFCMERVTDYLEQLKKDFPMNFHAHIR